MFNNDFINDPKIRLIFRVTVLKHLSCKGIRIGLWTIFIAFGISDPQTQASDDKIGMEKEIDQMLYLLWKYNKDIRKFLFPEIEFYKWGDVNDLST